jgi:hypothetical protein
VEASSTILPIAELIAKRCEELGISRADVVKRCGSLNVQKGLKKLEQFCDGQLDGPERMIEALPEAIKVSEEQVQQAIDASENVVRVSEEARWRASFVPHAIIVRGTNQASPSFVTAFGSGYFNRIDFDHPNDEVTFLRQAIEVVSAKLEWSRSTKLPPYRHPTGVVINYTPDRAVRLDLEGNPVEALNRAYRPEETHLENRLRTRYLRKLGRNVGHHRNADLPG